MTFEAFWDLRLNEDNILEHFDAVKQVFSKTLDEKIFEEYEVQDPIFNLEDALKKLNEYDKIREFTEVIKENNTEFYEKMFPFFNNSLVDYYCYKNKLHELESYVDDYIKFPMADYDLLAMMLKKILINGHINLVDKLVSGIYDEISSSEKLMSGTAFDLALIKYHIELEKVYVNYKENGKFEWDEYRTALSKFDFTTKEPFFTLCETALGKPLETVGGIATVSFNEEGAGRSMEILAKAFMKYMLEKRDMPFALSAMIWNVLYNYWESEDGTEYDYWAEDDDAKMPADILIDYIGFDPETYRDFVARKSGFIMDYRFYSAAILWGTCYVYDFFKELDYIENREYEKVKTTLQKYKKDLINENLSSLWQFNYVNKWKASNMESHDEKELQRKKFEEYYDADDDKIRKNRKNGFFSRESKNSSFLSSLRTPSDVPILREAPKIGRNEKVSVEYDDGTIKKDVKYKKVQKDIEMGKCKMI